MIRTLSGIIFLFVSIASFSQTTPKTKQANWQQRADFNITVKLNDERNTLSAFEKITYTNNSPEELKELYLHLWPNAYKNEETAFAKQKLENRQTNFYYSKEEDRGWIDSLDFKVNGQHIKWYLLNDIDICKLELTQPLKPGQTIEITTPFKVKLPKVFSRMGHEDQTYCISQWYPKPAVYDANGWSPMPYLDQGEFYSEFGKFDVSISVPKNYILAATGELQNEDEKSWLLSISNKKFKTETNPKESNPVSSGEYKTLRFIQDSIHDFAWFCDKRFKVERGEVVLSNGKKVSTWLYQKNPNKSAVHWVDTAIQYYSRMLGDYPYSNATVVVTPLTAGGGMEYPTITNVGEASRDVIVHEVGHNWFYGILASNERQHPWMDEGLNTYYQTRSISTKRIPSHTGFSLKSLSKLDGNGFEVVFGETPFGLTQLEYNLSARAGKDQPVTTPSIEFEEKNYGYIIYAKAPLLFNYLQDYLGDSLFDTMMKGYYEKWKFKHPLPDDFIENAKQITGKNLDWFFNDLMRTTKKLDYKIVSVKGSQITIKNKSKVAGPFSVSSIENNTVFHTQGYEGFLGKKTVAFDGLAENKLRIDAFETTTDIYRDNNTIRTKGLFKRVEPISLRFLANLDNPYRTQIFYLPLIGANVYNKTMLGIAFYNSFLPQKRADIIFAPLYSFGTNDIAGYFNFERHIPSNGAFSQIHLGMNASRFAYEYFTLAQTYNKISPYIRFEFNKQNKRSPLNQSISTRSVFIVNEKNMLTEKHFGTIGDSRIDEICYFADNRKVINKNAIKVTVQNTSNRGESIKAFTEIKQTINYDRPKKKMEIRIFGGMFLLANKNMPDDYQFRTSGNTGLFDYTFDQILLGRSENSFGNSIFNRQLIEREGNMLMPLSLASTNSWMVSTNVVTTIPGPLPIRIFADAGYINKGSFAPQTGQTSYTPTFQYVAGLKLVVIENIIDVNFPLYFSTDFDEYYNNISGYADENKFKQLARRITFKLNLNAINPIRIARESL